MSPDRSDLSLEEYATLRATIRERGTTRAVLGLVTFAVWAGAAVAVVTAAASALWTLLTLVVLAAGFETVAALHLGVERIGRYLEVFYESSSGPPAWEHAITAFRERARPAPGADPLLGRLFVLAALGDLLIAGWLATSHDLRAGRHLAALGICALCHAAFLVRVARIRRYSSRQREIDRNDFEQIRSTLSS